MLTYPNISPEIFSVGPFSVRWYGLAYVLGFLSFIFLGRLRIKQNGFTLEQLDKMVFYGAISILVGGRLGYVLFYNSSYYLYHPFDAFKLWEGGMSFHGGLLGVLVAAFICAKSFKVTFFKIVDFIAPLVPPGLFFGRLGNFINGELWGKVTSSYWGMVFPGAGSLPRHPSQLYEAFFEGLVLFVVLWIYSSKKRPPMAVSGVFAIGYGLARCFSEFFREPDAHIGYLAGSFLTMGMLLCLPLILIGIFILFLAYNKKKT